MSLNSSRSYRTVVLTVKLSKFFLKAWFHAFLPFVLVVVFCVLLGYYMHCCAICELRCPTRKKSEFAVLPAVSPLCRQWRKIPIFCARAILVGNVRKIKDVMFARSGPKTECSSILNCKRVKLAGKCPRKSGD